MTRKHRHVLFCVIVWATVRPTAAQEHTFIPVDDWAYVYVERLQRRGHLLELNPTALPYTRGAVRAALRRIDAGRLAVSEKRWLDLLRSEFRTAGRRTHRRGGDGTRAGVELDVGMRGSSGERLDVLRPEAPTDPHLNAGLNLFPNAGLHGYLERGRAVARGGLRFDLYYRDDPDGLDAANRLITRNDESYLGYDGRFASVYLGRFGRHWGLHGQPATMLSRNPVSMDQLALRLGGETLAWYGLLGELDSATPDGRFTGTAGADSVGGSIRRYLAAHRVDWRPSRRFGLTVMESALYSGPNAGISVKFLNPLLIHVFSVDGRPKNDENNGLVAGLLWARLGDWTTTWQLMLDDFDLLGETGEPAAAAITGSLIYAGWAWADVGATVAAVTARAYNTHQPEGRYLYLNRGLATQFNDFIHVSAFAPLYLDHVLPGVTAMPKVDVLLQGEAKLNEPFPGDDVGLILHGTTERTIRPGLEVRLQSHRSWWIRMDVGPNLVSNSAHLGGLDATKWTFLVEFGASVRLDRGLRLSFR